MNKLTARTLKIGGTILLALITLIFITIGIVFQFVLTSEKLTPLVVNTANQNLKAQLDLKDVNLTFFSSFPHFTLELNEGTLVSKTERDSAWQKTDSLVTFQKCYVSISPIKLLLKKIDIDHIGLENASVYAFRNKDGKANWDIVPTAAKTDSIDTPEEESFAFNELNIDRISLVHSHLVFDDRDTQIYTRIDDADLDLKASISKEYAMLDLDFSNKNILFWQQGELLANHIHTHLDSELELDRISHTLTLHKTMVNVNGVTLDVNGTLKQDSVLNKAAIVDLSYALHTPSVESVLQMIPESIVKRGDVKAKGEVMVTGKISGRYGEGQMPLATLNVKVSDASAKYKEMPYGIDKMELTFDAYVDLMRKVPSYANLKIFRFEGAHTHVLADASIKDLLGDPNITFHVKSDVDLTSLAKTFPLQEGVTLEGGIKADCKLQCRLSSLQKQDLGRIRLQGKVNMKEMALIDTKKDFKFTSNANLHFTGKENLAAKLHIHNIDLQSKLLSSKIEKMEAEVTSSNPKDTTQIVDVTCKLTLHKLAGNLKDSIYLAGNQAKASIHLQPQKAAPTVPAIKLTLNMDSLEMKTAEFKVQMDKGGFDVDADKQADSSWLPKGIIGFHQLLIHAKDFKLPIRVHKTAVVLGNRIINLRNAQMNIGQSDLTATGAIYNLNHSLKHHAPIRAKMEVTSNLLDCNQLINALNDAAEDSLHVEAADTLAADTVSTDEAMKLFVIPKNIDFELQTRLNKVTYGKLEFEDVIGGVDIKNQAVYLKGLTMRGLDSDMNATVVYQAKQKAKGYTGFDFNLQRVNIGKLVDFIPALDTIVPMLRSFRGIVDFNVAAESQLDSALNIQIPTLRSALHIKGDSLVLMDGETFAEISKKMMFKNKRKNLIDSIYVNMTVNNGNVTIYPFIVQMDRYRVAVGGTQGLDMNFKYHISVLKSPVPFKLGLNITGNLDKMKIRIGKAKYKDMVTPVAIHKVDSTRINLGKDIVNDFKQVIHRAEPLSRTETE